MGGSATARHVRVLVALLVAVAPLAGCLGGDPPPATTPTTTPPTGTTPTGTTPPTSTTPTGPTSPTREVGPTFFVARDGPVEGATTAAVGHANGDEYLDLYLATPDGGRLLLGAAGGAWRDVTAAAGVACAGCEITGAAIGDVDEDGANDLVVLTADRGLRLFLNDGDAVFVEVAEERGLADVSGHAVALADVDNDGSLDVAVAAAERPLRIFRNSGQGVFSPPDVVEGANGRAFTFIFVDDDRFLDLVVAGDAMRLYMNSNGAFTDATASSRLPERLRVSSVFAVDADNDQVVDLVVASDQGVKLLQNNKRRAFTDVTSGSGLPSGAARAAVAFDADNDGFQDVLVLADGGPALYLSESAESYRLAGAGTGLGSSTFTALAVGDWDRDGRLDALGLRAAGGTTAFLNRADAGPYFTLHLRGNESNYAGVGVKVTLSSGTFIMFRQTGGGGSPAVAAPIDPHFGIGKNLAERYTLAIKWPSEILQFENIERDRVVDRQLNARESASEAPWAEC